MAMLAFSTLLNKIKSGEKRQTVRANASHWKKVYASGQKLHVWLGNPRTGKAEKLGIANFDRFRIMKGREMTYHDAVKDGFESWSEFVAALMDLNRMSYSEFMEHSWAVIEFRFEGENRQIETEKEN